MSHFDWENEYPEVTHLITEDTFTPFDVIGPITEEERVDPFTWTLDFMRRPENLYFAVKSLFNFKLAPFQLAIQEELRARQFLMLIGSRGASKCVTKDTIMMSDSGFITFDDLIPQNMIEGINYNVGGSLQGDGSMNKINYLWKTPKKKILKITTRGGFELKLTKNHPLYCVKGERFGWKNGEELAIGDVVCINREETWFSQTNDLPEDLGYLFGLLVGDGGYTLKSAISFTTESPYLLAEASRIAKKYFNKDFKPFPQSKYNYALYCTKIRTKLEKEYGFKRVKSTHKTVPSSILKAPKITVAAFLRGLFDTDGTVNESGASITSASKTLMIQVQNLLLRFGIVARYRARWNKIYSRYYHQLQIGGSSARKFKEEIGFNLDYKKEKLEKKTSKDSNENLDLIPQSLFVDRVRSLRKNIEIKKSDQYHMKLFGKHRLDSYRISYDTLSYILDYFKDQSNKDEYVKLKEIYDKNYYFDDIVKIEEIEEETYDVNLHGNHEFVTNGFISHNSFSLAIFCMTKAVFEQGTKIALVGLTFRQAKIIFETCEWIWNNSPILRQMFPGNEYGPKKPNDKWELRLGDSVIYALPSGEGSRGMRAHIIIVDEFAVMPKDVYEVVAKGFAAVSSDPIEAVRREARIRRLKEKGQLTQDILDELMGNQKPNQIILAGTAYYRFNNLYKEFLRYHNIISSKGDPQKLLEIVGQDGIDEIDWRDFSIIRVPFNLLPTGFLSEKIIGQAMATSDTTIVQMEYGAVFPEDSDGFFRYNTIEAASTTLPIEKDGEQIQFYPTLEGQSDLSYIYGIDPASQRDNFAIVIEELRGNHKRVVYSWTTRMSIQKDKKLVGEAADKSFYKYCAAKIRSLTKVFPCLLMAIDIGGGGVNIIEALADTDDLKPGELPIYPITPEHPLHDGTDKYKCYDLKSGAHIIYPFSFNKYEMVRDGNHSMKDDLERKNLLFPCLDNLVVSEAIANDFASGTNKESPDSLSACVDNLKQLKEEMCSIQVFLTGEGRERFDIAKGADIRANRKDRYSALLMANTMASLLSLDKKRETVYRGGMSKRGWIAPQKFIEGMKNFEEYYRNQK